MERPRTGKKENMEKNKKGSKQKKKDPFHAPLNVRSPHEEFEEKGATQDIDRQIIARLEQELSHRFRYFFFKLFLVLVGTTVIGISFIIGFAPFLTDKMTGVGIIQPTPLTEKPIPAQPPEKKSDTGQLGSLVKAIQENTKSNRQLVETMVAGNKSIVANLAKLVKNFSDPKVVVINPGSVDGFTIKDEKQRILKLGGIDIDDPIVHKNAFSKIKSKKIMDALIRSFNRILEYQNEPGVSDFMVKNARKGKTLAIEYRKDLK